LITDRTYRRQYQALFRDMLRDAPAGHYDEMALPSYTHPNPAMSWLFWRRLDTALDLARDVAGRSVLDFGCGGCTMFLLSPREAAQHFGSHFYDVTSPRSLKVSSHKS